MGVNDLFRSEAVNAVKTEYLGSVVLARPIALRVISAISLVLIVLIALFVFFGAYTKRDKVAGQLMPRGGLIKVVAPQSGIVVESHVSEGDFVDVGQILFTLSSERMSYSLGDTQKLVINQLIARRQSLQKEAEAMDFIKKEEVVSLSGKIQQLENSILNLESQYLTQKERVSIAQDIVERYSDLFEKKYISKDQLLEKRVDLLDQFSKLKIITRESDLIKEELSSKKIELRAFPQRNLADIAQIERALFLIEQELTETEAKRQIVINAPQAGIVTGVLAQVGQSIEPVTPLLSIVPAHSPLIANLYAPSKTIGFIKVGDAVLLRYAAYPYQKFGQYGGRVRSISETALSVQELSVLGGGKIPSVDVAVQEELYYQIMVDLDSQNIIAYGEVGKLKAGMVLEASIMQEKRRIYEWIFDPLYSLHGSF